MSRTARATALVDQIRAALDAVGLVNVLATIDYHHLPAGYTHGVVVVVAPKLEFPTWNQTEETWSLHVAAGPWDNVPEAWKKLDDIVLALQAAELNLAKADPTDIQIAKGEVPLPGYVIELNPDIFYD